MGELAPHQKKGDDTRRMHYIRRLSAVLLGDGGADGGRSLANEAGNSEPPPSSPQAPASSGSPSPTIRREDSDADTNLPADYPDMQRSGPLDIQGEQAAQRIAEALTGMMAHTAKDLLGSAANDRAKLEAIAGSVVQISEEVRQIKTEHAALRPQTESLRHDEAELRSKLAALDSRVCPVETASQWTQDRLSELLVSREQGEKQIQTHTQTLSDLEGRLRGLSERLDALGAHLDSHGEAIQELREEIRQGSGLFERFVGTLRRLDFRKEPRVRTTKPVKVFVPGERETVMAGCVVDASESGLGLVVEGPVPIGSEIRLDADGVLIAGKVSHCRSQGEAYAAGLSSVRQLEVPPKDGS
jgi:prefoldin subunit 5